MGSNFENTTRKFEQHILQKYNNPSTGALDPLVSLIQFLFNVQNACQRFLVATDFGNFHCFTYRVYPSKQRSNERIESSWDAIGVLLGGWAPS